MNITNEDRRAANTAFDIAFQGNTETIDDDMAALFSTHRESAYAKGLADGAERERAGVSERVDDLAEALFYLSDKLRGSGFLADDANHAEYERVVAAYHALSKSVPGVPFEFALSRHADQDLPTIGEVSAIWRNGVANTAAVIDIARRKFRELVKLTPRERGAVEAFDGFLDKAVQDWFDATRKASPTTYDEAEQVYKDHAARHADQGEGL